MIKGGSNPDAGNGSRIACFAFDARGTELPAAVVERAKLHILDTLAAIVSGASLEAGRAGQSHARELDGKQVSAVLGTSLRTGRAVATDLLLRSRRTVDVGTF
ncbi:MAG: MmgE/PrpD family protein, partial [Betaproteobacteria bacterium]